MNCQTETLACGLRVVFLPSSSPVVYCGYQIGAGSQNEGQGEEGLAHFCEHVTFKGTQRRTAIDVINCLESVGGELNAYTTKADTVFYAAALKDHLPRAIDLLTDVVFHSIYPQREIDKEVEVICDEIESYNDSPAELIYDDFENILFDGMPLGHNILGTSKQVRAFTTADALRFTQRYYRPENAVFFVYGNVEKAEVIALLHQYLTDFPPTTPKLSQEKATSHSTLHTSHSTLRALSTHQAHVMLGQRAYGYHHPRRPALLLLNNILGGPSLNARLNLALRERRGLVYTVESTLASYDSIGAWSVYFGCDPEDIDECIRLVKAELHALTDAPLTQTQLDAARQQMKGQLGIAADNRESLALDMGKSFLHYGQPRTTAQVFAQLDQLTPAMLQEVAQEIFQPERLVTLIYK